MYDLKIVRFLLYRSEPDRQKLMEAAMLDGAERLDKEFWYGVNCFSNLNAINDRCAAKMSLRLFTNYFEKVFLCAAEFEQLALDFYQSGNKAQLNSFLERHQLDEIDMQSYKSYFDAAGKEIVIV